MHRIKYQILIILVVSILPLFTGCDRLETDVGTVAGALFYSDSETRVSGGWIRVYQGTDTPVIIAEVPVDNEARFFISLPEGEYYIGGSTSRYGDYSVTIDPVTIINGMTTRLFISIGVPAPPPAD
jgi:hypothetical protein